MTQYPSSFDKEDLLKCARGELFGPGNAQLPAPPMLMMDRITEVSADGGEHLLDVSFSMRDKRHGQIRGSNKAPNPKIRLGKGLAAPRDSQLARADTGPLAGVFDQASAMALA